MAVPFCYNFIVLFLALFKELEHCCIFSSVSDLLKGKLSMSELVCDQTWYRKNYKEYGFSALGSRALKTEHTLAEVKMKRRGNTAPKIIAYVRGGGRAVLAYLIKSKQQFESATLLLVRLRTAIWEIPAYVHACQGLSRTGAFLPPSFFDSFTDIFRESWSRDGLDVF